MLSDMPRILKYFLTPDENQLVDRSYEFGLIYKDLEDSPIIRSDKFETIVDYLLQCSLNGLLVKSVNRKLYHVSNKLPNGRCVVWRPDEITIREMTAWPRGQPF